MMGKEAVLVWKEEKQRRFPPPGEERKRGEVLILYSA